MSILETILLSLVGGGAVGYILGVFTGIFIQRGSRRYRQAKSEMAVAIVEKFLKETLEKVHDASAIDMAMKRDYYWRYDMIMPVIQDNKKWFGRPLTLRGMFGTDKFLELDYDLENTFFRLQIRRLERDARNAGEPYGEVFYNVFHEVERYNKTIKQKSS